MDGLLEMYRSAEVAMRAAGFADSDIEWSEGAGPPKSPEEFASEAIWVICNSGMKNTVARRIYDRIFDYAKTRSFDAHKTFGHEGKARAINEIWDRRTELFHGYLAADDKIAFCASLPWIGNITKYHLAKNFGVDVAKPDIHIQRLADHFGMEPQAMCASIAECVGLKARTVDLVLWRACAEGFIDSRALLSAKSGRTE